jgi:hypothetical protein
MAGRKFHKRINKGNFSSSNHSSQGAFQVRGWSSTRCEESHNLTALVLQRKTRSPFGALAPTNSPSFDNSEMRPPLDLPATIARESWRSLPPSIR